MARASVSVISGILHDSSVHSGWREREMEIGYPTDVKHVAHIGWDGPSVGGPNWVCDNPFFSKFDLNAEESMLSADFINR